MDTSLFDYALPPERIAQRLIEPRDHAKLLVLNRTHDGLLDRHIHDLPDLLQPGDLLVFNDSKVFKARLRTGEFEVFLLRPDGEHWLALAKPGRKLRTWSVLTFSDGTRATVVNKLADGTVRLDFHKSPNEVFALADRLGEVPLPPYITTGATDPSEYQTVYARETGSVAAPTAGFHFTPELFARLETRGVQTAFVTLHVGLGTFRPMKTATLEEHVMHEEWMNVPDETWRMIEQTKAHGHRVIAVGTTTVRTLESMARLHLTKGETAATSGQRGFRSGFTDLFITPGFDFKMIDGLLTNFHLPKSTLLVLVSAFAGREKVLRAYRHAIDHGYRFYSFGDAMLILP